jgi:hypothetical protein
LEIHSSRDVFLSPNASREAISLAASIKFMMEKEFIVYVQAVFSWLDEPFISSVFVYGSDGELYKVFREKHEWIPGKYEVLPYAQFPLLEQFQFVNVNGGEVTF